MREPGPNDTISDAQPAQWFRLLILSPPWIGLATMTAKKWQEWAASILQPERVTGTHWKHIRKDEALPIQLHILLCNFKNQSTWSFYWNTSQCLITRVFWKCDLTLPSPFPIFSVKCKHSCKWSYCKKGLDSFLLHGHMLYLCPLLMHFSEAGTQNPDSITLPTMMVRVTR